MERRATPEDGQACNRRQCQRVVFSGGHGRFGEAGEDRVAMAGQCRGGGMGGQRGDVCDLLVEPADPVVDADIDVGLDAPEDADERAHPVGRPQRVPVAEEDREHAHPRPAEAADHPTSPKGQRVTGMSFV